MLIRVNCETPVPRLERRRVRRALKRAATLLLKGLNVEVSVLLVDEEVITRLNSKYFDRNETTDVIAFPMMTKDEIESLKATKRTRYSEPLGDIIICAPQAARQAESRGLAVAEELELLAIHGLLHLLGYQDSDHDGAQEMAAVETKMLNRSIIIE